MVDIALVANPLAVAANTVGGLEQHTVYADNATVGTSFELVTNENADITFIGEAAGDTVDVVSADSNDDGDPVGTGALTVTVKGLDVNFNYKTDDITLNGTGAVATSGKYTFINEFYITATGTGLKAAGLLTLDDVTGSTTLGLVESGAKQMGNCMWMVGANETGYIHGFWYSVLPLAAPIGQARFQLQVTERGFTGAIASEVWRTVAEVVVDEQDDAVAVNEARGTSSHVFSFPGNVPLVLPPKTIVRIAALATTTGVAVQAGFNIWIQGKGAGTQVTQS